jgi:hypothetical protein
MNPPDQPTPTPRTDKAVQLYRFLGSGPLELEGRFADFARTLECELTTEREKVRVLREALEKYQHTVIAGGTNPALAALAATEKSK